MRADLINILYYIINLHKPYQIQLINQYSGNEYSPISVLGKSYRISTES
jgi:hypothetical protein